MTNGIKNIIAWVLFGIGDGVFAVGVSLSLGNFMYLSLAGLGFLVMLFGVCLFPYKPNKEKQE